LKPNICILRTDGTNCDIETMYAVEKAGGRGQMVHVNQLRAGSADLKNYKMLIVPGGFTYGDDVHSGKILAVELISYLREQLLEFVEKGNLVLGICNGFQVLVRTGLLPQGNPGDIKVTLINNDSGRFECRWVNMRVEKSNCVFTRGMEGTVVSYQAAHGEGKFYTDKVTLEGLEKAGQVVFRYCTPEGEPTSSYPANPNGSLNAIAGISDSTGRIMGLMPHPERFVEHYQHPNWRRQKTEPHGLAVFKNAIDYINKM
jgi:phosphoribosylformylglycinamidine synthase